MKASAHPRQLDRLRTLHSYEILDTDREKEFNDVVKLVAEICGTSISIINLIDAERQWFKAEVGLGIRETPIETSICSHVILQEDFVEIRDTLDDRRLADNPLCANDPGLRFYAGALLKSDDGLPLGTLCVLDWQPRELTPLQRDAIRVLAHQVMAQLDLRRALRLAETLRQEVDHRVKNSLQLLVSLTRIQIRSTKSQEARNALDIIQHRTQTVSMLHELLYRTDVASKIDLAQYVENIADFLRGVTPDNITIETDVRSVMVGSKQATCVGILLNEFAANSIKHAFPNGQPGRVRFALRRLDDGLVAVDCADNGIGLTEDARLGSGLGMKIAEAVSGQLGTKLDISATSGGVTAKLVFDPAAA